MEELAWLGHQGLKAVLSLTERPLESSWIKRMGVEYSHIPIPNRKATTVGEIHRAVQFVESAIKSESPTLVHCAAGKGRTGMILAAYLVGVSGMKPREAVASVRRIRPDSVPDQVQETAVDEYGKYLNK
jgi:atypical dual specificity phosphatase